jgi:hypothetical protein
MPDSTQRKKSSPSIHSFFSSGEYRSVSNMTRGERDSNSRYSTSHFYFTCQCKEEEEELDTKKILHLTEERVP